MSLSGGWSVNALGWSTVVSELSTPKVRILLDRACGFSLSVLISFGGYT